MVNACRVAERVGASNLNQKLGDERMTRALENAEKITAALTLLEELETRGSLDKIMRALSGDS